MNAAPLTILVTGGAGFIGSAVWQTTWQAVTMGQYLASLSETERMYLSDDVPASPRDGAGKEQK